jgi:general stress protein 26
MTTPQDIQARFWKLLHAERTMMLGIDGADALPPRPMTAQAEEDHGPLWFFSSTESLLVQRAANPSPATATFTAKGHDLFASISGQLLVDNDRSVIDRLWNPFVAAWYEGGKTDPRLALLKFDPGHAEFWLNGSSVVAGVKMLMGIDPKQDYKDKVAKVELG